MTVGQIINQVRWCIDEEAVNAANFADASAYDFDGRTTDNGLMNNIIRNKIATALRWVCLTAPAEQLSGGNTSGTIDIIKESSPASVSNNLITLDSSFIRLIRVKGDQWHRAIMGDSVLREDSDEYMQLRDSYGANATLDRPQAALINTKTKKVEVWPVEGAGSFTITYVVAPPTSSLGNIYNDSTEIGVPPMLETSFIYYLAFLLLSTYGDARAKSMYDIAMLNIGYSEDRQRQ